MTAWRSASVVAGELPGWREARRATQAKKKEGGGGGQRYHYWAPLTNKRHPPQPAQPRHTNHWAPRTRKRHQQEHRPQRPTICSDLTQHAKGRTGGCPGPRKETATQRNVTPGGGGHFGTAHDSPIPVPCRFCLFPQQPHRTHSHQLPMPDARPRIVVPWIALGQNKIKSVAHPIFVAGMWGPFMPPISSRGTTWRTLYVRGSS